jgi:hypothetical protein
MNIDNTQSSGGSPGYHFNLTTETVRTYEDGFAEGYSRAWKECWQHFIDLSAEPSPAPKEREERV